jgi:hypothetical protein
MSITSEVLYIFKKRYDDDSVIKQVQREHPLFDRIAKSGGFTGEGEFYSIKTSNPQGVSAALDDAQTAVSTSRGKKPYLTRFAKYGVIRLAGEDMHAAPNGGAFYDYVTDQTDAIIEEMGHTMAFDLYRDGSGMRGQVSSLNGNVLTLSNANDVRNFHEGMTLVADDNASGASNRAGSTTVSSVDEDTGTVTVANAAAANIAQNDYLFRYGEGAACAEGLALCTPLVAPVANDSFRGIDRSSNVRLLAGSRVDDTGSPIEENVRLAAVKVRNNNMRQDTFFLNPLAFHTVVTRTNAKVTYENAVSDAQIYHEVIMVGTPAGTLKLISDPDCPTDRGYGALMSEHAIRHLEGLPHVIKDDGRPSIRQTGNDGIEIQVRAWWNYRQRRPGCFSVISI